MRPALHHLTDGIGERSHLAQPGGHRIDARGREAKAVDDRRRGAFALRPADVDRVGSEYVGGAADEQVGGGVQGGVLVGRRGQREHS